MTHTNLKEFDNCVKIHYDCTSMHNYLLFTIAALRLSIDII